MAVGKSITRGLGAILRRDWWKVRGIDRRRGGAAAGLSNHQPNRSGQGARRGVAKTSSKQDYSIRGVYFARQSSKQAYSGVYILPITNLIILARALGGRCQGILQIASKLPGKPPRKMCHTRGCQCQSWGPIFLDNFRHMRELGERRQVDPINWVPAAAARSLKDA